MATLKENIAIPNLSACFEEAGRIHPSFGLHLERVVPQKGLEVCGKMLPAGTIVCMNAWVVHQDPDVFGPDSDSWRPERCPRATKRVSRRWMPRKCSVRAT
ncbi:hypothetical protein VSDG_06729 [Cytospora chrysosperma]|uniref:Uncharacterized protein n=1 Tax=Cytospora chrysosperma TaxID=252740 RepID=A0A423VNA5_CYTCH|nr:hypothetical protein VSDG_06729 [Valsa sordida]